MLTLFGRQVFGRVPWTVLLLLESPTVVAEVTVWRSICLQRSMTSQTKAVRGQRSGPVLTAVWGRLVPAVQAVLLSVSQGVFVDTRTVLTAEGAFPATWQPQSP